MQNIAALQSTCAWQHTPIATHCPYCAFQCGMYLTGSHEQATVSGNEAFPVNKGGLCIKGWNAAATLTHSDRLLTPLARDAHGALVPVTWDEAFVHIAQFFRDTQRQHGQDAVGVFGSGSLTNEKAYLLVSLHVSLWVHLRLIITVASACHPPLPHR